MPRKRQLSAEDLRQTLREWDPTIGDARLSAEESRKIARLLAVSPFPEEPFSPHRRWPQFALATGGGLAVVLVLLLAWRWPGGESAPQSDPLPSAGVATEGPAAPDRNRAIEQAPVAGRTVQVQLIARGGTRIVWVLNPQLPAFPDNLEENSYAK
jgi:hypothetical protein